MPGGMSSSGDVVKSVDFSDCEVLSDQRIFPAPIRLAGKSGAQLDRVGIFCVR